MLSSNSLLRFYMGAAKHEPVKNYYVVKHNPPITAEEAQEYEAQVNRQCGIITDRFGNYIGVRKPRTKKVAAC